MKIIFRLLIPSLLILSITAHAVKTPLRNSQDLWEPVAEEVLHVSTARVILADYDLIRRDFPEVKTFSNDKIDAWLIANTAFISKEQAAQEVVNTPIKLDGVKKKAFRPREYRRAHVFQMDTGGLIDAKGTGSVDPHQGNERNGLAALADVIREFMFEKMVKRIFNKLQRFDTVGTYAAIDFGFDVKWSHGGRSRAGVVLRQAHTRYHLGPIGNRQREDPVVLPNEYQLEVEMALRPFGVSAAINVHPGLYAVTQQGDQLNLQGATDGSIVDFGGFRARKNFTLPLYTPYDSKGNANVTDADIVLKPDDVRYVQPNQKLAVPFELWGNTETGGGLDNPYIWSEHTAIAIAEGRAGREAVENHFKNLIEPVEKKLASYVGKLSVKAGDAWAPYRKASKNSSHKQALRCLSVFQ